jgi:flagellar protein FliJ
MSQDIKTLAVMLGHHERLRDAALADHQRAQALSAAAESQALQLRQYRHEYEQRWRTQFSREGRIELVHCYQSFTERLTLAVEQQTRVAEHAAQQVERVLSLLRDAETRCASVRKLIERRLAEQHMATERVEQKQTDEAASRAAWSRLQARTRPAPLM